MIKFNRLGNKLSDLFNLIIEKKLYTEHHPENTVDFNRITPARFILAMAAFEWECQQVYGDYKYKENKIFKEVTDTVYYILDELKCKSKGKRKGYFKTYQNSFKYSGVSLSEKINYALKDNQKELEIFINSLYKQNGIDEEEFKLTKIAQRLEKQRNNYAHGQIDRELNELVVLDLIVLEWLLYTIRLKQLGFDLQSIKHIINELFMRGFYIKE